MSTKAKRGLSLCDAAHRHPGVAGIPVHIIYRAGRLPYATPEQLRRRLARLEKGGDAARFEIATIRRALKEFATP